MQESVVEVLFYLFDDLLPECERPETNLEEMAYWLGEAGFHENEIRRAMKWFSDFTALVGTEQAQEANPQFAESRSVRIFSEQECRQLDDESRDYLLGLVQREVLDGLMLEKIIERLLALEEEIDITAVRWIAALVALNICQENDLEYNALREEWLYPADDRVVH